MSKKKQKNKVQQHFRRPSTYSGQPNKYGNRQNGSE